MGIDIYVDEIFYANQKKHQAAFDEAVAEREKASDKAERDRLWKKVSEAYDAMFAVGYLRENYHGGPYVTRYLGRAKPSRPSSARRRSPQRCCANGSRPPSCWRSTAITLSTVSSRALLCSIRTRWPTY